MTHRLDGVLKISAGTIHLVDKREPRHVIFVRLAPNRLRLRLHAVDGVKNRDRAVEHAQRALDFHGEIDVARSVDNID